MFEIAMFLVGMVLLGIGSAAFLAWFFTGKWFWKRFMSVLQAIDEIETEKKEENE